MVIAYTQSYWNPYFMLPVSLFLLALLVWSKHTSAKELFLSIGFLFGLGLQFHFSFVFAILISLVWLAVHSKLTPKSVGILLSGFAVGFLPLIIFDVRNHFYNLSTFLLVLQNKSGPFTGFHFNTFYLLSVFPFVVFALSVALDKIHKKQQHLAYVLLGAYVLCSPVSIIQIPKQNLSYPTLQKLASLIEADKPKDYNIVDQLTQDNRAMALRYLVTVHGYTPLGIDQYPYAKTIYVYASLPLETLLKDPVWEIRSFLPYDHVEKRSLETSIFLYKLSK
jgi:hypothetical protein